MNFDSLRNNPNFKLLKPNEKCLLLIIYSLDSYRFTISTLAQKSDIHRDNVYRHVQALEKLGFIDLCLIGKVKEIVKK